MSPNGEDAAARSGPAARSRTASDELEGALLDAAEAVLIRDGLPGITVRAVAREAGVAPMGVYNRFGSKDGLVAALALRAAGRFKQAVIVHGGADPEEAFRSACHAYRDFAIGHQHSYRLLFLDASQLVGGRPDVIEASRQALDHLAALVRAVRLPDGLDSALGTWVQAVWSALHGAVALELNHLNQADPSRSFDALIETLLHGLRPAKTTSRTSC